MTFLIDRLAAPPELILRRMYLSWLLSTVAFVYIHVLKTKEYVTSIMWVYLRQKTLTMRVLTARRYALLSLLSTALTLRYMNVALKVEADAIPMYIPLSTDLGVFLTVAIHHIWPPLKEKGRGCMAHAAAVLGHNVDDGLSPPYELVSQPMPRTIPEQDVEVGVMTDDTVTN